MPRNDEDLNVYIIIYKVIDKICVVPYYS